jgi:hypothetical protein
MMRETYSSSKNSSGDTNKNKIYLGVHWRAAGRVAARGNASFGRTDAAQVCSDFGLLVVDGHFECSVAPAARQIASERW